MTEETQKAKSDWTSVQVYAMSALCLLVGITVGYLFRGSTTPQVPGNAAQSQMSGSAPAMGGQPGAVPQGMPGMGGAPPTPDQMKQMADKKVAPLLEQISKNPNDVDTILKVGGFYMAAQQFDSAQKYFQKAVDVKATPETLTRLANSEAYGSQPDKAIDHLNKALQLDPKYANALFNLGMLKWQAKGDTKGAIACWETLIKTNPNHPQIEQVKQMVAQAKEHAKMPAAPAEAKGTN
jgi:cytochrome c-type biogenesis protein CcmH/NrfG